MLRDGSRDETTSEDGSERTRRDFVVGGGMFFEGTDAGRTHNLSLTLAVFHTTHTRTGIRSYFLSILSLSLSAPHTQTQTQTHGECV